MSLILTFVSFYCDPSQEHENSNIIMGSGCTFHLMEYQIENEWRIIQKIWLPIVNVITEYEPDYRFKRSKKGAQKKFKLSYIFVIT